MKTIWRIVGIGVLVAVLGSMMLGIASAGDLPAKEIADKADSSDAVKRGKYGEKSSYLWDVWYESLVKVAAEELGFSTKDLWLELKAGMTIAGLAEAQGVDPQAIHDAYSVRLAEWLDAAVAKGAISQADADAMLAKMQGCGLDHLSETWADVGEKDKGKWGDILTK